MHYCHNLPQRFPPTRPLFPKSYISETIYFRSKVIVLRDAPHICPSLSPAALLGVGQARPAQCFHLTDTRMEVSRRRLQKHLEPARPLRRCIPFAIGKQSAIICKTYRHIKVDNFTFIVSIYNCMHRLFVSLSSEPKINAATCRISYTRDFLIGLANCPEAQKKPEFLPNHPIVLMAAVSWMLLIGFMVASPMNILGILIKLVR
uniref:Uncharacterized protein n=1 Tax=Gasterosteus aculeatus aculeatus TaxID=481459 RepID=A0AAQ4R092_GASAC